MSLFDGHTVICLDCEVLHSPDDLPSGWKDKAALGLSIGAYWDGLDGRVHWFDEENLWETIQHICDRHPMIISFNGKSFDSALMWECLGRRLSTRTTGEEVFRALALQWQKLWVNSYDILAEVWRVTGRDYAKGNSLDALCAANGLQRKTGHGAHAPKLWQRGRIAEVLNYCRNDVEITLALAEMLTKRIGRLERQAGAIDIRYLAPSPKYGAGDAGACHLTIVDQQA